MDMTSGSRSRVIFSLPRFTAAIFATAALAGCSITIDTTAEDAEAIIEADFEGDCQGSGTEDTGNGTVTYTKDDSSGNCVIALTWEGTLVDLGPIKEDIDDDAEGADITLEEIGITVKLVSLTDADGQDVDIPELISFNGSVAIDGNQLYAVDGSSFDTLVSDDGLTVTFSGENDPVVQAINTALDAGAPLAATAQATLTVSSNLPLQNNNPHFITFNHDIKFTASASPGIF